MSAQRILVPLFLSAALGTSSVKAQESEESENRFRELLSDEQVEAQLARYESLLETIYRDAEEGIIPVNTLRVNHAVRGGNIDRAGIPKGSHLISRGPYRPWAKAFPLILTDGPSDALVLTPEKEFVTYELGPGPLEAFTSGMQGLELAYLRGEVGMRNEAWDDDMVIACRLQMGNSRLTETLLHRIRDAGYQPDDLIYYFHSLIHTHTQWGPSFALDHFFNCFEETDDIPEVYLPMLHNALVASGRIDYMERLQRQCGDNIVFTKDVIDRYLSWRDGIKRFPDTPLLERISALDRVPVSDLFTYSVQDRGEPPGEELGNQFKITTRYDELYKAEYKSTFVPHDFHYRLTVKIAANSFHGSHSAFTLLVANLFNEDEEVPEDTRYGTRGISHPHRLMYLNITKKYNDVGIFASGESIPGIHYPRQPYWEIPYVEHPVVHPDSRKAVKNFEGWFGGEPSLMKFDLVRLHNEMAIYVNDVVYLHLPANPLPTREIDFNLHSRGFDVEILEHEIWKLKGRSSG